MLRRMISSMRTPTAAATNGSPMIQPRPFRKLVSSDGSRTMKIFAATRTREGFGRIMKNFNNRELTGHPEVPQTMRDFRDDKTHHAHPAASADGSSRRAARPHKAGACGGEANR